MKTSYIVIGVFVVAVIGFMLYMSTRKPKSTQLVYSGGQNPSSNPSTYLVPLEQQGLSWLDKLLTTSKKSTTTPATNTTQSDAQLADWMESGSYV